MSLCESAIRCPNPACQKFGFPDHPPDKDGVVAERDFEVKARETKFPSEKLKLVCRACGGEFESARWIGF